MKRVSPHHWTASAAALLLALGCQGTSTATPPADPAGADAATLPSTRALPALVAEAPAVEVAQAPRASDRRSTPDRSNRPQARRENGGLVMGDPDKMTRYDGLRVPTGLGSAATPGAAAPSAPRPSFSAVTYQDSEAQGIPEGPYQNVWGIFIGVSRYATISNLKNADNDAVQLAATMADVNGLRDPEVITNEKATLANIQAALERIGKKAGPGDLFVFHYSGHGIGIQDNNSGVRKGLMLLSGAKADGIGRGDFSETIDMEMLDKMASSAGIRTKHKLVLLDCCYGGLGTNVQTRNVASISKYFARPATYAISAGDSDVEVLDLSVDFEGHGLLSGFLIQALRSPQQFPGVRLVDYEGRRYINMKGMYGYAGNEGTISDALPQRAANTLQAFLNSLYRESFNQPKAPPIETVFAQRAALRSRITSPEQQEMFDEIMRLYKQRQAPQEGTRGNGQVFLPYRPATLTPTPTVTPTAIPAPTTSVAAATTAPPRTPVPTAIPTATQSPSPVPPTATAYPSPTQSAGGRKDWQEYCTAVGEHWGSPDYGREVEEVFRVLFEGTPPAPASRTRLALMAEVLARPTISDEVWGMIYAANGKGSVLNPEFNEQFRLQNSIGWNPLPFKGGQLSAHYEFNFRFVNQGTEPLHYYLIAMDEAGVLQYVSPSNPSCDGYTFGVSPLPPRSILQVPEADPTTGASASAPVQGDMDQSFILVASRQPWPELETALTRAGTRMCGLYQDGAAPAAKRKVGKRGDFGLSTRALGKVTYEKVKPVQNMDTLARTDGHFLIMMWQIDIVPKDQMIPTLQPTPPRRT